LHQNLKQLLNFKWCDTTTLKLVFRGCPQSLFKKVDIGGKMNKTELVSKVAESAEVSKAQAGRMVDAMLEAISGALAANDSVTLIGFGTFTVRERAARKGRNPRTGNPIEIKSAKIPAFKPGKALKDAVN
jgi:DNA-binding protein HU-beta